MSIELSEFGNFLVYRPEYSAEFVEKTIRKNRLHGLRIFDFWEPLPSLDFLREYSFLDGLEIVCRYDQNFDFLSDLAQLKHLSIGMSATMENEVDLSGLGDLQYLSLQWRKGNVKGIERCQRLRELCLIDYSEKDLSILSELTGLLRLVIKTGSIMSLNGIQGLDDIESILLANCRKLQSIGTLNGKKVLTELQIDTCRRIRDYEKLVDLPSVKHIRLTDCNGIPTIAFIDNFPSLRKIELTGNTNVVDGNIAPLRRIEHNFYFPRPHYY